MAKDRVIYIYHTRLNFPSGFSKSFGILWQFLSQKKNKHPLIKVMVFMIYSFQVRTLWIPFRYGKWPKNDDDIPFGPFKNHDFIPFSIIFICSYHHKNDDLPFIENGDLTWKNPGYPSRVQQLDLLYQLWPVGFPRSYHEMSFLWPNVLWMEEILHHQKDGFSTLKWDQPPTGAGFRNHPPYIPL
jgi:hypothetical protein